MHGRKVTNVQHDRMKFAQKFAQGSTIAPRRSACAVVPDGSCRRRLSAGLGRETAAADSGRRGGRGRSGWPTHPAYGFVRQASHPWWWRAPGARNAGILVKFPEGMGDCVMAAYPSSFEGVRKANQRLNDFMERGGVPTGLVTVTNEGLLPGARSTNTRTTGTCGRRFRSL